LPPPPLALGCSPVLFFLVSTTFPLFFAPCLSPFFSLFFFQSRCGCFFFLEPFFLLPYLGSGRQANPTRCFVPFRLDTNLQVLGLAPPIDACEKFWPASSFLGDRPPVPPDCPFLLADPLFMFSFLAFPEAAHPCLSDFSNPFSLDLPSVR